MTNIHNKTILITGASGGFGYELTRQLLTKGASLLLTDLDTDSIEAMVTEIRKTVREGDVIASYRADLSNAQGADDLYTAISEDGHEVDILINNAGIGMFGRFDEVPSERWEQLMQINLLAPMRLTHHFLPQMIARQQGHIVNISSLAGWVGTLGLTPYNAAKFGLRGFSEGLLQDLKPHPIEVTTVYPFFSKTAILDSPEFGSVTQPDLPDSVVTNPTDVIAEVVAGIEKNKQHVFPDRVAKIAHILKRISPRLLYWMLDRV